MKSRYEFIHHSCALIYLLISFFLPSLPPFFPFTSLVLPFFPILSLPPFFPSSDKETYSNYISFLFPPLFLSFFLSFFLRHAHYSFSHTSFELSRSLTHSNAHVLTYTPLLSLSVSDLSFGYSFSRSLYSLDIAMRV